ncbi:aspartate racemase [Thermosinus carboxydivorans Nor1]|uniref:Aspartate racemase n=1 Tax=Thermosinus carboxydivorans Nor1 TaxID=401526 RepID=A1HNN7_9FIRM|nr:amino acid racemase [Thermosinus carboxydivorans]EAX48396.1 aspartate racemase [Thermosinus carboxydivorans Nor1]
MKKLGLVGGIGPASTLDYYKGITEGYRMRTASDNYPQMIIDSLNLAEMYAYVSNKQWDMFINRLVGSIKNLAAGGAEFAAMAANTAHIVFDEVNSQSPLPLISIVDETCKYAQSKNCKSVVIFGTAFTMSSGLYSNAFAKYGIDAFVPTADEQKAIHNIIFPNLQAGIVLPEDKRTILQIAKRMIAEKNADALVLGCTELPLIIQENDLDVLLLDTTQIHIDAILNYMLA